MATAQQLFRLFVCGHIYAAIVDFMGIGALLDFVGDAWL